MRIEVPLKAELLDLFSNGLPSMDTEDILRGLRASGRLNHPVREILKACDSLTEQQLLVPVPGTPNKWRITPIGESRVCALYQTMKAAAEAVV
jgi:hypothetical protein